MNKHINNHKIAKQISPNIVLVERDHMPASVATELLCTARCTNAQRRTYMDARSKVFASTQQPKPPAQQMSERLQQVTWAQLCKWLKRMRARRDDAQRMLTRFTCFLDKFGPVKGDYLAESKKRLLQRAITVQNLRGTAFEQAIEALETEVERRQRFWASLRKIAPSIAAKIENR